VVEKLDIPSINTEKCCDQVIVFDGVSKEIARVRGEGKSLNVVSTGNIMTVMFVSDYSNVKTGFRATYLAESIPDLSVPELQSESGVITSSLNISQPSLCMSLIYSLPSSGSLNIYADQSTAGKIYFRQTHTNLINGWRISRYVSNSTLDIRDDSTKLSIHLEGRKSKIFSIAECSTDGDDVYVFPGRYWEGYLPKNLTSKTRLRVSGETVSNCNHGGAYDKIAKTCVCPTGFAGPTCTEACGPNHFGLNCSGTCSSFQDGCKNIIFCNITHNCSCAAGFTGNKCEKECEPGTYGANCQNLCGKCKEGSCNKYTGECDDLCEEGYYPPLCQHQYAFLSQAPSIKERSFNSVVISANFQNPKGMGIPHLYEVQFKKIGSSEWNKTSVQEINSRSVVLITVTDLNVGTKYLLRIVVICEDGNSYRGDSVPTLQFETDCQVPGKVRHLTVNSRNGRNIQISWKRPLFTGSIKGYRIQYQCVKRFICEESCGNSSGSLETKEHSANLYNLLPHVQYKIRVAAYSSSQGPFTSVFATTKTTSPDVSPIASNQPIVSKSNTTVIVQWLPPPCPGRNGQLTGYHFSLTSETEKGTTILQNGTTKDLQTSFTSLTPMTQYQVFVYAMTSHGWNTDFKLVIPFSSSATVPDTVQNLEVYKRGRRMIGIRWAKPKRVYGTLESFTVAHHQKGSEDTFSHTMSPNACSGWPHLYCYTINKYLQPDKQYIVSVTARNHEIDEDGMASEINAVTRENAPDAPASLTIRRSTSTSFEMEWELPNLFNGELRSFLVNIEHIDSFNETECCEYFPVQELPVREESPIYNLEVTGLNPASTYIVSVSAKTITMGPSINATYHTSPLAPTDLKSPEVIGMAEDGHSYVLKIKPIHMISSTNSTYLLLVLPPGELSPPVIWERELLGKLIQAVNASFYIVSEFTSVELVSAQETEIGTGRTVTNGTLGQLMDPKLTPGYYRVGLALVQRYGHAISVDLATSNRFEFRAVDLERVVS
ncbi:Down syndrome cell adhesion molecule-like protein Dscam2, partial [Gryllus bimaculatus]